MTSNPKISVVLPTRNDGEEVELTINSVRAAGATEILLIADGTQSSLPPLGPDVVLHVNKISRGPAYCRDLGARMATGDVIIFADCHIRAEEGAFVRFAKAAITSKAIMCAATRPLSGRDWVAYGGTLARKNNDPALHVSINLAKPKTRFMKIGALYGSCYAMTPETYKAVGGWPQTTSWGYNEQALSLAALFSKVPMLCDSETVIAHRFKKQFGYPVQRSTTLYNRYIVHYLLWSEEGYKKWEAQFDAKYPNYTIKARKYLELDATIREREKYQSLRKATDEEVEAQIVSGTKTNHASRAKDSDKHKLFIIGTGRSGTRYITELLQACGVKIGHERIGEDGAVGWMYTSKELFRGSRSRKDFKGATVLHQVREPLSVIGSTTWMHAPQKAFMVRNVGHLPNGPMLRLAAAYWLKWNRLAQAEAEWTYRVEDIYDGSPVWEEFCQRAGIGKPSTFPLIEKKKFVSSHPKVTWDDLNQWPTLRDDIKALAKEFGYE